MTASLPLRIAALALAAFAVLGMGQMWGDSDPGGSCSVPHQGTHP